MSARFPPPVGLVVVSEEVKPEGDSLILVIEDDQELAEEIRLELEAAGHAVQVATTLPDGLEAARSSEASVLVIDRLLQGEDALWLVETLRREGKSTPVLIISGLTSVDERIAGLKAGADDYLIKPFGLQELLARIRAVLRRSRQPAGQVLQHGALTVDLRTHKVSVSGQQIAVTPKEFAILECLASDPGRVVSRQEMLERAWDEHWYGPTKVLDVHMAALRRKLGDPGIIETVYGHGFRLADPGVTGRGGPP